MDITEFLDRKKPAAIKVPIICDSDLADAVTAAEAHLRTVREKAGAVAPARATAEIEEAELGLDEARAAAREATLVFRFEAISGPAFEEIRDTWPSTETQRREHKQRARRAGYTGEMAPLPWDPTEFPIALIAACCADPKLTPDQARELWTADALSQGERDRLLDAAMAANATTKLLDGLGKD